MALVVTPGASNADSYAALADADAYFTARGVAAWTGTDAAKENALRLGTAYLDNAYRDRWIGVRVNQDQALAWPRCRAEPIRTSVSITIALIDTDGFEIATDAIPVQVAHAAMEAALIAIGGTSLEPTLTRGNAIKSIGNRVEGAVGQDIVYRDDAPGVDRYLAIEGYLRGLVTGTPGSGSGSVPLLRA